MISRVADHCFWLGRYLERAEHTARVLHVTTTLALDAELTPLQSWAPIIIVFGEEAAFVAKHGEAAARRRRDRAALHDLGHREPRSIVRSVGAARENARSIREVVSLEVWEIINELYLYVNGDDGRREYEQSPWAFYRNVRKLCAARARLHRSTMLHDMPLDFIWLGVELERAGQTARTSTCTTTRSRRSRTSTR
jgi:uncharacterized alpha-E superfamily protein